MIINVGGSGDSNITAERVKYNDSNVAVALSTVEDEFTANGNRIYLDYQDGKYGYNTDPERGADTFNPFKSGGEPELLWTNPNPDVNFNEQTVSLDLSEYKAVIIQVRANTSSSTSTYPYIVNPSASSFGVVASGSGFTREANVSNIGVRFGTGYYGGSRNNGFCIPYKIYGLTTNIMEGLV